MDGPNVNWKVFKDFQAALSVETNSSLLNIGSCGLHIVNNSFKEGAGATGWAVGKLLSSLYYLFKDSPARREDFGAISPCKMPLKFCSHRWIENSPVCERVIEIWPSVVKYESEVATKMLKNPTTVSFDTVRKWVKDPLALAKMHFLNSVAKQILPFLTKFQSDTPMLPFMAKDLEKLLRQLMSRFVKEEVLDETKSILGLLRLNITDSSQCCHHKKIDIGFQAERELKTVLNKLSERRVMDFRMQCRTFLQSLVKKLLEKSPLQYSLFRNMKCLNPQLMAVDSESCIQSFKICLNILVEASRLKSEDCDVVFWEYKEFLNNTTKVSSDFLKFDESPMRLDELFFKYMSQNQSFSKLWNAVGKLLLLSHGQASVERGFSVNKELIVENMKETSIASQRVIYDHITSVGGIKNVILSKSLLQSVNSARQKYMMYLDDKSN